MSSLPTTVMELQADPRTEQAIQELSQTLCKPGWLADTLDYRAYHHWRVVIGERRPVGANRAQPIADIREHATAALQDIVSPDTMDYLIALLSDRASAGLVNVIEAIATLRAANILTVEQVAEDYHMAASTVRGSIHKGYVPAHKSGKNWLIRRADAEARWGKRK